MAPARSKGQQPVGSTEWISSEREQANQFVTQEVEEFGYSVRNELEWLNEHMADIFSRNQRNFTDIFKTPGKLRGKTPRTARKNDVQRAPLTDIFAPNPQSILSPSQKTPFFSKVAKFQVAEDEPQQQRPQSTSRRSPLRVGKENTDSGYHGMTEDETDGETQSQPLSKRAKQEMSLVDEVISEKPETAEIGFLQVQGRSTEDSFVSAREGSASPNPSRDNLRDEIDDNATVPDEEMRVDVEPKEDVAEAPLDTEDADIKIHEDEGHQEALKETPTDQEVENESLSVSDTSSPDQPLLRKSILNFASLPPRETLTGKRSIGARASHSAAQPTVNGNVADTRIAIEDNADNDFDINTAPFEDNAAAVYNKTSTQRLHDRINMLGQSKEVKPSQLVAPGYPRLPNTLQAAQEDLDHAEAADRQGEAEDDDDWIAPIEDRPSTSSSVEDQASVDPGTVQHHPAGERPRYGHQKSISTTNIASPTKATMAPELRHQKSMSVSNPNFSHAMGELQSTTPVGSPIRRFPDGPLSASKSKLYSVLKSAKSIFASSAGASAQAKMEAMPSPVAREQEQQSRNDLDTSRMPGGFDIDVAMAPKAMGRPISVISTTSVKSEGNKSNSSESEKKRDREAKEKQQALDSLNKLREKESKKAAEQKQEREEAARVEKERIEAVSRSNSQKTVTEPAAEEPASADEMPPPTTSKSMLPPGKLRAPTRVGKPTRQPTQQAVKPVALNIRMASQSHRLGSVQPSNSASSLLDPTPPPTSTRPQSATTRAATAGTRAGSAQPSNARVRALEAAARRKEQEEKAAERKIEQKREMERQRAAKAEEERKVKQERQAAEQQRAQEARLAAQKQVAEQRKLEQQRREAAAERAKADAELAAALEREKTEREKAQTAAAHPRGDVQGTLRQLGKSTTQEPPVNQAKPVKRQLQQDEEAPQRPGLQRGPPSYQQQDAKRRKTDDEDDFEVYERHSVMAPPKRPSNMRKEPQPKFTHGYAHAPPPAAHHTQNMFKATLNAQHQLQHNGKAPVHPNDTIKLSNARIPFAENANPPAGYPHLPSSSMTAPTVPSNTFKTPARPAHVQQATKPKSSPAYPNGENINLPEINTDSEDESDSDTEATGGFRAPSWVASPALRDLLTQQQLVDPESIFGPIEPLHMDEVFRNGKNAERLKRFRDRGESALWTESGDAVTSAEKRRDREARARVVRDGGWSFSRDV